MSIEIKAPSFPESIAEGTVATWHHQLGDVVKRDDLLVDIETDKVVLEVVAPADGTLAEVNKAVGDVVTSEEVIALLESGADGALTAARVVAEEAGPPADVSASPAARKLADESQLNLSQVTGTGKGGRITKEDVSRTIAAKAFGADETAAAPVTVGPVPAPVGVSENVAGERVERRVPMSRLRASIAKRLVEAQHSAAMLTTFNEVNMEPVKTLRAKYQDLFQQRHNGTRLGFMSFFVRAAVEALKRFPAVNASIDGTDIVYHGYYDIGVAVGTDRGLVVPVVRDADALSLAQVEDQINDFGIRARANKLMIEDMAGGTFTISNGGVFGSLMSTPILNPPQTAILGMHKIQDRPIVENGKIIVRPMMYLAVSYDHRLIDGQEAVRFLVAMKDLLEDPARILLEL